MENKERIQVKACGAEKDLTSFGPKSEWDKIYFIDFYCNGEWDGSFDIYRLDNDEVVLQAVNEYERLKDQQKQKRRPRFSVKKKIIEPKGLKPILTGNLFNKNICKGI